MASEAISHLARARAPAVFILRTDSRYHRVRFKDTDDCGVSGNVRTLCTIYLIMLCITAAHYIHDMAIIVKNLRSLNLLLLCWPNMTDRLVSWLIHWLIDRLMLWWSVGALTDEFLFFVFDLNIVKSLVSAEDKGRLCSLNTFSTISSFGKVEQGFWKLEQSWKTPFSVLQGQ